MKALKQLIVISFIFLNCSSLFSQDKKKESTLAGVFLTHADFKVNKLTYEIDCGVEKQKIKLHDFFTKPYFDVYFKGEKQTLQKKDVYGYRDCHNDIYRFFNNLEYQLEERGNINIYSLEQNVAYSRGVAIEKVFYFSARPDGEIELLTPENLKSSFPDNHKFHYALDEAFKGDADISAYDKLHKMYKVNYIYETALK